MTENELNHYLKSIGKECFVKYYEIFADDAVSRADAIEIIIRENRYKGKATGTRVSNARKIIKDGNVCQALALIIRSQNISDELRQKASELLNLNSALDPATNEPTYKSGIEGIAQEITYLKKSRDPKLVEERKKIDNFTCQACEYRKEITKDKFIIDVHHLNPIGKLKDISITNINELICLCPNCHRIAHSKNDVPYTLQEIKKLLIIGESSVIPVSSVVINNKEITINA